MRSGGLLEALVSGIEATVPDEKLADVGLLGTEAEIVEVRGSTGP